MPWCDDCDRYLNPNSMHEDGSCPGCGSQLASPRQIQRARRGSGSSADALAVRAARAHAAAESDQPPDEAVEDQEDLTTPWHFKVLLVALVIYLLWRLIQGIIWAVHKL